MIDSTLLVVVSDRQGAAFTMDSISEFYSIPVKNPKITAWASTIAASFYCKILL